MPDLRPIIEQEQVLALLRQHFTEPITHLVPVEGEDQRRASSCFDGSTRYGRSCRIAAGIVT